MSDQQEKIQSARGMLSYSAMSRSKTHKTIKERPKDMHFDEDTGENLDQYEPSKSESESENSSTKWAKIEAK